MEKKETTNHLTNKSVTSMIRPLKKFDFKDCLLLKERGYLFFGTDFCERLHENCLILYPFKKEEAAKKFSHTDIDSEPFIIEINEELEKLTDNISDVKVYVQFL